MIIDIKLPAIRLSRLHKHPHRDWQRHLMILPRLGYVEGRAGRKLLLPGLYETRVSCSQNCRLWREVGGEK
jgi:hypothetical protein